MKNIEKRVGFWSEADIGRTQGGSKSNPFESHVEIFKSKNVLEIGPGWGRQFKQLSPLASTYCVADICQKVLDRDIYQDVDKFLIRSHQQSSYKKFDVITFWYVIHHILNSELDDFFDFLNRHLHIGGNVFFNCPSDAFNGSDYSSEDANGDGIKTTPHGVESIANISKQRGFKILYQKNTVSVKDQNCYIFLIEKTGG